MIIFNTTYCVPAKAFEQWHHWLKNIHLPQMQETGLFTEPRLCRIFTAEDAEDSYSLQFCTEEDSLLQWKETFGKAFESDFSQRFGNNVLYFSTVMEVLL
jgi:hypothetical protein